MTLKVENFMSEKDNHKSDCFLSKQIVHSARFYVVTIAHMTKIVWPQSKVIRSSSYCPSLKGVRFIVCPFYRDSTVSSWDACGYRQARELQKTGGVWFELLTYKLIFDY